MWNTWAPVAKNAPAATALPSTRPAASEYASHLWGGVISSQSSALVFFAFGAFAKGPHLALAQS